LSGPSLSTCNRRSFSGQFLPWGCRTSSGAPDALRLAGVRFSQHPLPPVWLHLQHDLQPEPPSALLFGYMLAHDCGNFFVDVIDA